MRASKESYGVRFVNVSVMNIPEDKMSSRLLAASSQAAYIQFIRVRNTMTGHKSVLLQLANIGKDTSAVKTLGITHPEGTRLQTSSESKVFNII